MAMTKPRAMSGITTTGWLVIGAVCVAFWIVMIMLLSLLSVCYMR